MLNYRELYQTVLNYGLLIVVVVVVVVVAVVAVVAVDAVVAVVAVVVSCYDVVTVCYLFVCTCIA